MTKTMAILVCGTACGFAAVGCSSTTSSDPFGPTPDFAQVQAKYQTPTGTFAAGSEESVISGFGTQAKAQSSGFVVGIGSSASSASATSGATSTGQSLSAGDVHFHSLQILDNDSATGTSSSFCPALANSQESGTCACPGGGSLAYDFSGMKALQGYQGGPIDVTLRVRAAACSANGASVDGTEFVNIKSSGAPSASEYFLLYDIHLAASANGANVRVDADFGYQNGQFWFAVDVNDGSVVVSSDAAWDQSSRTGTLEVRDKNETWTCQVETGKGTCTSDKGTTRVFAGL